MCGHQHRSASPQTQSGGIRFTPGVLCRHLPRRKGCLCPTHCRRAAELGQCLSIRCPVSNFAHMRIPKLLFCSCAVLLGVLYNESFLDCKRCVMII